jgi:trans-aconitate methyltransferase
VLDRVPVSGIAVAIDAGCGTGKITRELLERLPETQVVALDASADMLAVAERELAPQFGDRVRFVQADLADVTAVQTGATADLIFSTATFHWLRDHPGLFRNLFALLNPGGGLIAQCGGGPNIARFRDLVDRLMRDPRYAPWFADWIDTWYFANDEETATRLAQAGFIDIETSLEYHPAVMPDAAGYHTFVSTVILRDQLARLPDPELRTRFVDDLTDAAAGDDPPYLLDYWRLNLAARRSD